MNLHTPTIPTLQPGKIAHRILTVEWQAQELGISQQIHVSYCEPDHFQHRSVAALTGAILVRLPPKLASEIITHGKVINPARPIRKVHEHVTTKSAAGQQAFEMEADETQSLRYATLEEYLKHMKTYYLSWEGFQYIYLGRYTPWWHG